MFVFFRIRLPKRLKKDIERFDNVDWQKRNKGVPTREGQTGINVTPP